VKVVPSLALFAGIAKFLGILKLPESLKHSLSPAIRLKTMTAIKMRA
jgi:hypothetical protein